MRNCGMRNAERVYGESKPTQLTCGSPGHEYGVENGSLRTIYGEEKYDADFTY